MLFDGKGEYLKFKKNDVQFVCIYFVCEIHFVSLLIMFKIKSFIIKNKYLRTDGNYKHTYSNGLFYRITT